MNRYLKTVAFGILALANFAHCDTWGGADVKSIRMYNEKLMSVDVTTMQCTGAPCSTTLYYLIDPSVPTWPGHNTSEMKQFQAMLLTASSTGKKINVNFQWNGYIVKDPYTGATLANGGYFLNWLDLVN
jgi:hypothetical protein